MKANNDEFHQEMQSGMLEEAAMYGYAISITIVNKPKAERDEQVKAFLARPRRNVAVVLVDANLPIYRTDLRKAKQQNIPVFVADIPQSYSQQYVTSTITSNNQEGGAQAADIMCRGLTSQRSSVAVLDVYKENTLQRHVGNTVLKSRARIELAPDVANRVRGFSLELKAKCKIAHIVADKDTSGGDLTSWPTQARARLITVELLGEYRDLGGIFAFNDEAALGAARGVDDAGLTNAVRVVGFDGVPEGREAVAAERLFGDVRQYPDEIGRRTIDQICHYASSPSSVQRAVLVSTSPVTEDNAEQQ